MNYLIVALVTALVLSGIGNFKQYSDMQKLQTALTEAKLVAETNIETARVCSMNTDRLMAEAEQRRLAAQPVIVESKKQERKLAGQAQQILSVQPVDPTDGCKSAATFVRGHLRAVK